MILFHLCPKCCPLNFRTNELELYLLVRSIFEIVFIFLFLFILFFCNGMRECGNQTVDSRPRGQPRRNNKNGTRFRGPCRCRCRCRCGWLSSNTSINSMLFFFFYFLSLPPRSVGLVDRNRSTRIESENLCQIPFCQLTAEQPPLVMEPPRLCHILQTLFQTYFDGNVSQGHCLCAKDCSIKMP